jgi:hypothetical protein
MADLDGGAATDPDAQATVTDFLDYTEYLPSDILRSLILIRGLDETYQTNSYQVHELTKQYGSLPSLASTERPDPLLLRNQISTHLDTALNARESSYAEACRLFDVADRHYNRLNSIISKLHALPKPPSRDPTPIKSLSPEVKRSRSGRKIEHGTSTQRLTLNPPKAPTALLSRPRGGHRITVPGEVLPAWNPDSPLPSTEVSDYESDVPSPVRPVLKLKHGKPSKIGTETTAAPKREKRESSIPYRKPTPPPEEAELGGKHRPWIRLTEWEMYKLRKKMKKNHTWDPSDIMIQRTLETKGRGWDNYYAAKTEAQKNGTRFVDVDNIDRSGGKIASTPLATPTEEKSITLKRTDSRKPKPKQDTQAPSQASLAAREAEQAARRLGDIGSAFKNLFSPFSNALASLNRGVTGSPTANAGNSAGKKAAPKPPRKRKIEELDVAAPLPSPSVETQELSQPKKKKQKIVPTESPVPAVEPAPDSIKVPTGIKLSLTLPAAETPATTRASSTRQQSTAPKTESTPAPSSRPASRRSAMASVEPESTAVTRFTRRTSTPAARHTPIVDASPKSTAASRRSRREAPGTVTQSSQDGGAAVSVSKRKAKPGKQAKVATPKKEAAGATADVEIRVDVDGKQELLNPDEERYCICGDVSWGEMICCELDEKVRGSLQALSLFANIGCSASMANGSTWNVYNYLSCRPGRSSGIALVTGRSSRGVRIPTDWLEEESSEDIACGYSDTPGV